MFSLLKQRCMMWLGHVCRMEDGRIPEDHLYGELVTGKRPTGRPQLQYKDTCKRDLKVLGINTDTWEAAPTDRSIWTQEVHSGLSHFEENLAQKAEEKRSRRKTRLHADRPATTLTCGKGHRKCHSHIRWCWDRWKNSVAQNSMVSWDRWKPAKTREEKK